MKGNGMNLPPLPELPTPAVMTGRNSVLYVGELPSCTHTAFTAEQVREFALSYGRAVQQAERERALRLCREQQSIYEYKMGQAIDSGREERWDRFYNYHDAVENIAGWIESGQENILAAAAIRNGVIREGEGE